jgi:uncharacterized protein
LNWSKYNYLFNLPHSITYLLYNSLSNVFIELSDEKTKELIFALKENKIHWKTLKKYPIFTQLIDAKILVESDEVEILKFRHNILNNRYSKSTVALTILPTLDCNFNCSYCFESNKNNSYMSKNVEDRIINYIKQLGKNENLRLNVCWMGGEPLLNFNRIKSISRRIAELGIQMNGQLITNGYLLNKKMVAEFHKLNIRYLQISLDGIGSVHDNIRTHKTKKYSFNRIIENIEMLYKYYEPCNSIHLNVRVNLSKDEEYLTKFIDTYEYLRKRFPYDTLNISPGFLEDASTKCNVCNNFNHNTIKDFYLNLSNKFGPREFSTYPNNVNSECAARSSNSLVIGPEGEVYKCWEHVGDKSNEIGNLAEDGNLKISNEELLTKYLLGADFLYDTNCNDCYYMPLCTGGCPDKRVQNHFKQKCFDCCCIQKDNIEEILIAHFYAGRKQSHPISE